MMFIYLSSLLKISSFSSNTLSTAPSKVLDSIFDDKISCLLLEAKRTLRDFRLNFGNGLSLNGTLISEEEPYVESSY